MDIQSERRKFTIRLAIGGLKLFSLTYIILLLYDFHHFKGIKRLLCRVAYYVFIFLLGYTFRMVFIAFIHMKTNQFDSYEQVNPFGYYIFNAYLGKKSLILIAAFFYLTFVLIIANYTFYQCVEYFGVDFEDMVSIVRRVVELRFDIVNRLYYQYSDVTVQAWKVRLARGFVMNMNRFFNYEDKLNTMKVFMRLEFVYANVTMNLVTSSGIIFMVLSYHLYTFNGGVSFTMENLIRLAAFGLYSLIFFIGTWGPICLVHFLYLVLYAHQISWRRYCRRFTMIDAKFRTVVNVNNQSCMNLWRTIRFGQELFVQSLCLVKRVDRRAIANLFTYSICFTLLSNVICIVELSVSTFKGQFILLLSILVGVNLLVIFLIVFDLLRTGKKLYFLNKPFLHHQVSFSRYSFQRRIRFLDPLSILKWNNFHEISHTKRIVSFTLGPFGKITSKSVLSFLPIYSSVIMFIIPAINFENRMKTVEFTQLFH